MSTCLISKDVSVLDKEQLHILIYMFICGESGVGRFKFLIDLVTIMNFPPVLSSKTNPDPIKSTAEAASCI